MGKEYITNGGNFIKRDGFGDFSINGKKASPQEVKAQIRQDGGQVHDLKLTDSKTKRFAQMQKDALNMRNK